MSNHTVTSRSSKTRLNKYLAQAGICSRRQADELIEEGRVRVNGELASLGAKVSQDDLVEVDGQVVNVRNENESYAFYKPRGVVSTRSSQGKSKTIYSFFKTKTRLFSVGRLDKDSEGLIILTTDGQAAQKLTHPKYQTKKTYEVWLEIPNRFDLDQVMRKLTRPRQLDGKKAKLTNLKYLGRDEGCLKFSLVLTQGLNHQIRRLVGQAGYTVKRLKRTAHGPIELDKLKPGEKREISLEV